ncbi:antitoxin VbhA family protein [Sporolactobacillus sp. STCC-11]|uniref:antitoxin VbhA family protein n=1 Tax=Sporolactobacillus caesalpiniae TaxID=3230362 RepID=UPI00339AF1A0
MSSTIRSSKLSQAMSAAKHSLALEGLHVTQKEEADTRRVIEGTMSMDDLIQKVKEEAHA